MIAQGELLELFDQQSRVGSDSEPNSFGGKQRAEGADSRLLVHRVFNSNRVDGQILRLKFPREPVCKELLELVCFDTENAGAKRSIQLNAVGNNRFNRTPFQIRLNVQQSIAANGQHDKGGIVPALSVGAFAGV